jgi:hypothetical protein
MVASLSAMVLNSGFVDDHGYGGRSAIIAVQPYAQLIDRSLSSKLHWHWCKASDENSAPC